MGKSEVHEVNGFTIQADPSVPIGEIHMRNDKGELVGVIKDIEQEECESCSMVKSAWNTDLQKLLGAERETQRLRGALLHILHQPFEGSWDAQAAYIQTVLAPPNRKRD